MFKVISDWLAQPFRSNGSAKDWFLFVGLLLAFVWVWKMIGNDWESLSD
jgi:hypothetical protein